MVVGSLHFETIQFAFSCCVHQKMVESVEFPWTSLFHLSMH